MTASVVERVADLENPTGRSGPWLAGILTAGSSLFPPGALLFASGLDPAQTETADLQNHSASLSERAAAEELRVADEDVVLDSPNFTPPQLTQFRARGLERRNRWA
jgi:hypothetical protein